MGLEEITERVSAVAKAMGECRPRDFEGEGRRSRLALGLSRCRFPGAAWEDFPGDSPGPEGRSPWGSS